MAFIFFPDYFPFTCRSLNMSMTLLYLIYSQRNLTMHVYLTFTTAPTTSHLQHEINSLTQWTSNNNRKLNVKKTKEFTVYFFEKSTFITACDGQ